MKKDSFEAYIKPVIVLTVICIVVSALLGLTNSVTEPIIIEAKITAAENTRFALLAEATEFEQVVYDSDETVDSVYRDLGGAGYVITVTNKGYKGPVTSMVGIDSAGAVTGVSPDVSGETAGVGTKAGSEEFLSRFVGLTGSAGSADAVSSATQAGGAADSVDVMSGATYSSTAVKKSVSTALAVWWELTEADGQSGATGEGE